MSEEKSPKQQTTLRDDEVVSAKKVDRRGALGTIGAFGAALAAGIASLMPRGADATVRPTEEPHENFDVDSPEAIAQACSDSDSGRRGDPAGQGRSCGRRRPMRRRCTDSDRGRYADPSGRGRNC